MEDELSDIIKDYNEGRVTFERTVVILLVKILVLLMTQERSNG